MGRLSAENEVVAHEDAETTARVDVARQRWLKRADGRVPGWVAMEYMAQCIAAPEALRALAGGEGAAASGLLVAVRQLELEVEAFQPDATLHVTTRPLRGRPGLGALSHECTVSVGDGPPVAAGRLSVSVQPLEVRT